MELVSPVEEILRRDPAGVYSRMDFASRDRYRHAVEDLAEPTGEAQVSVALSTVESARRTAEREGIGDRAAHVGHHLIGPGRRGLEIDVAYRPRLAERLRRWSFAHATAAYLGGIGLLTGLGVFAAYAYAGATGAGAGGAAVMATVAALLALLPASELAVLVVQRIVAALVPPRRLPRLDFVAGIPESDRTMVVVPVILGSVGEVERLLAHLEVQALGNLDPRIHFALLSDFKDARTLSVAGDDEILTAAVAGIEELNRRHVPDGNDRFYLLHRDRRWNPKQGVFMGWERKRGKLEELNRRLRSPTEAAFSVTVGDLSILPSVRYVLTLDADTRLPRGAARTLIGIISHPLNRPVVDADPAEGHGGLRHPPATRQRQPGERRRVALRAGVRRAHRRRPLHDGGLGHLPGPVRLGDLHRQGAVRRRRLPGDRRLARPRKRAAVARSLRGAARADRAGLRRGGGGRLPGQRPRARAPATALGARRLADPRLALPAGPDAPGSGEEPPPAHRSVEDPRQPPAQPGATLAPRLLRGRVDLPAGASPLLDPRRSRGRRVPVRDLPLSTSGAAPRARAGSRPPTRPRRGSGHRLRAGALDAGLPPVPRLGDGACHRPDARPARHHAPASPRVGDGGRAGSTGRRSPAAGGPFLLLRDGGESDRSPGAPRPGDRRASRRAFPRAAVPRLVGGGARLRVLAQPVHGAAPAGAVGGGPRSPARGGAQDVALFRDPGRSRGSLAPSRQFPGRPSAPGSPPDLADQHRHGSALYARGARPGPAAGGGHGRTARPGADHGRRTGAARGAPPELV